MTMVKIPPTKSAGTAPGLFPSADLGIRAFIGDLKSRGPGGTSTRSLMRESPLRFFLAEIGMIGAFSAMVPEKKTQ
jgi:hypothetical protein